MNMLFCIFHTIVRRLTFLALIESGLLIPGMHLQSLCDNSSRDCHQVANDAVHSLNLYSVVIAMIWSGRNLDILLLLFY